MIYSCAAFRRGFQVKCFTAYHNRWAFNSSQKALLSVALKLEKKPFSGYNNKHSLKSLEDLQLPALKPPRNTHTNNSSSRT
jgi:hypothetical protein